MSLTDDDPALVARSRQDDHAAYAELVRRHAPRLAAYLGARIRRIDVVETLIEEAIEKAWKYLGKLDDDAKFGPWFRKLGANLAMLWHKAHPGESLRSPFPVERCVDLEEAAAMNRIDQAIGQLSENERMAVEQGFRAGLAGPELVQALHARSLPEAELLVEKSLARLEEIMAADPAS